MDQGRIICFIGPYEEHCCCVRHLFLVTSAIQSAYAGIDTTSRSPVPYGVSVATGDYGGKGNGEKAEMKVVELQAKVCTEGLVEQVWNHVNGNLKAITDTT